MYIIRLKFDDDVKISFKLLLCLNKIYHDWDGYSVILHFQ